MACRLVGAKPLYEPMLEYRPLGTKFSEILMTIHTFSFMKMHLKMSSVKWRPFYLGLNVLMDGITLMTCTYRSSPSIVILDMGSTTKGPFTNDFAFVFGFSLYSISFHPNCCKGIITKSQLCHLSILDDLWIWWQRFWLTAKWNMAIFDCEGDTLSETVSQVNNGTAIMASVTMYVNFCTQVQLLFQTGWPCYLILCGH